MAELSVVAGIAFGCVLLYVIVKGVASFASGFQNGFANTTTNPSTRNPIKVDKKALEKQAWLNASNEVQSNCIDEALWAKAFADCKGDEQKQKAMYLSLRQHEIFEQLIEKAKQK